jgi:hypothetical protein
MDALSHSNSTSTNPAAGFTKRTLRAFLPLLGERAGVREIFKSTNLLTMPLGAQLAIAFLLGGGLGWLIGI